MAHVAKMNRAACGHMFKHYERARDESGEYLKFGNQDIDFSRTAQNYNLAPDREISQGDFVRQRCEQVGCLKRKDVNVMCSWIVTAPQSLVSTGHERQFFADTYSFLSNRYGKDNIVSAYVHMDEVTPHMHFAFVPVVEDKKCGKLKVSAKECVNRKDLQFFHTDLDRHLSASMGERYQGDILNGATEGGNKTVYELKLEDLKKEVEKLEQQKNALLHELKGVNSALRLIQDVDAVPVKARTGGKVEIFADDWMKVADTAKTARLLEHEYSKIKTEVDKLRTQVESTIKLKIEKSELESKIKSLRKRLDTVNHVLEILPPTVKDAFFKEYNAFLETQPKHQSRRDSHQL